jgi:hypothetical protein
MRALLAKKVEFKWILECQESFETLMNKLTTAPVLILLDVHKPFSVYCDASYIVTVGPCSRMLCIKNKVTQLLTIRDLRHSKHYPLLDIMIFR